jgi:ketosteroid isomerase-like protein
MSQQLSALEDQMWQANREGDATFYVERLRDDALVVSRYGVMDKQATVAVVQANQNPYLKTSRSDEQVIDIDGDNALITYRVDVTALVQGREVPITSYATTAWHRDDTGDWQVAFHQQTALGQP